MAGLSADQLTARSGAEDWQVADVLSHLGSGSEISRYPRARGGRRTGEDAPENQDVWDRWNALAPADQAAVFVESEEQLVATFEALSPEQRESITDRPRLHAAAAPARDRARHAAQRGRRCTAGTSRSASTQPRRSARSPRRCSPAHFAETMTFLLGFVGKPEGAPTGPGRAG